MTRAASYLIELARDIWREDPDAVAFWICLLIAAGAGAAENLP